jgi:ABC-type transport system involved in cytochrome c biogenesis ATPase subunit
MEAVAVRARGITKCFGDVLALDSIDLDMAQGQIHGLVGPNGAGKTTLLGLLLGLAIADKGRLEILGTPIRRALAAPEGVAGFVDGPGLYPSLTARQNLAALASLRGYDARTGIDDVLDEVGLTDVADDRVRGFSLGMRQRLGLATARLTKPPLLGPVERPVPADPGADGADRSCPAIAPPSADEREQVLGLGKRLRCVDEPVYPDTVLMLGRGHEDPGEAGVSEPAVDGRDQVGWASVASPDHRTAGRQEGGHGVDGRGDVVLADVAENPARKHQVGRHRTEVVVGLGSVADEVVKARPQRGPAPFRQLRVDLDK